MILSNINLFCTRYFEFEVVQQISDDDLYDIKGNKIIMLTSDFHYFNSDTFLHNYQNLLTL